MDIHKPKPWHGWREFLKEYAIIVVGVLTALGAEQIVVLVDRHEQVEQARAALKHEVRYDLTNAVLSRREDRCLGQVLLLWEGYAIGGPKPSVMKGSYSGLRSTVWDTTKSGAVANMSLDERVAFADFYSAVSNQMGLIHVERDFSMRLAGFGRLPKLNPQEGDELLRDLPGIEGLLRAKVGNYDDLIEKGRKFGVEPDVPRRDLSDRVDKLCALAATVKVDGAGEAGR